MADTMGRVVPICTTAVNIEGYHITRQLGVVRGIVVRAPNIGQSLFGALKTVVGGNIQSYADVCEKARLHAYEQMLDHALALGANAVIAIRYDSSEFMQGAHEVLCYGTAVTVEKAA